VVVIVKSFLPDHSRSVQTQPAETVKPGMKFYLPDFDWSKKDSHVVLVLQKGCHFCSESAPFYQQLVRQAANRADVEIVAALPENATDAQQYLKEIQLPITEMRQIDMTSMKVRGTPTILLVDQTGTVSDVWIGKLQPDKELEVLNRLHMKV
jgi:thioredoxin-related protein